MSSQTVARRYATALADVVAGKVGARIVQEELVGWELMISSNAQLKEIFANPTIPYDQKRKVLRELITRTRVGPLTGNFLEILLKNQRVTALEEINRRLAEVLDTRSGVLAAHVTTARPISDDARIALSGKTFTNVRQAGETEFYDGRVFDWRYGYSRGFHRVRWLDQEPA